jgi:hypothetical protein
VIPDLGEDLISCLCLGVKSRALVLNAMAENLDALKCGGWGVFIAPTTKMVVGEAVRWCASHITQLLGFDRWSSDSWDHRTVRGAPDSHCSLSGAPSGAALTLRALFAHCSRSLFTFADDNWRSSRCSTWHTGQSGEL